MFQPALPIVLVVVVVSVAVAMHYRHGAMTHPAGRSPAVHHAEVAGPGGLPRARGRALPTGSVVGAPLQGRRELRHQLDRWVVAGLISSEQAAAITDHEQARLAPAARVERRVPVVAEALGYLGGVLGIVGVAVLVSRWWDPLGVGGRSAVIGGATAAAITAGALVRESADPALARLRGFLWLAATAGTAMTAATFGRDVLDSENPATITLLAGAAVAVESAALWQLRDRPLQQATACIGTVVAAGGAAGMVGGPMAIGWTVWTVAAALAVAGFLRWGPEPWITTSIGATGAIVGATISSSDWHGPGLVVAALTALAVEGLALTTAVRRATAERALLVAIGSLGALSVLPETLHWYARDAGVVTGIVVWLLGAATLAVGASRRVVAPVAVEIAGGLATIGGAALCGTQSVAVATLFGLLTAIGYLALGMLPGRVLMSAFGSVGLLVNVPWAIQHFFPGEGRVPLLIAVAGMILVAAAVLLTRMGGRFRREVHN